MEKTAANKVPFFSEEKDRQMDRQLQSNFITPEGKAKRKKGVRIFFAVMLALTLCCSLINWGVITGWGTVRVQRMTLSGYSGDQISGLLYIPEGASKDAPAPLLINYHGNAGNARNHESWSMEFARRGFVVLAPDLYGAGDSENSTGSFIGPDNLMTTAETFYLFGKGLDYIDGENIIVAGHSMGGSVTAGIAGKYDTKALLSASGALGSQFRDESCKEWMEYANSYMGNTLLVFGDVERDEAGLCQAMQDWLDIKQNFGYEGYVGAQYTQEDQIVGSFEEGNAVYGSLDDHRVHEAAFVNQETISKLLWFGQEAVGDAVPNYIDPEDQVWMWKDYIGLASIYIFGLFICALALLFIEEVPFFEAVKRAPARNIGLRNIGMMISIILGLVFPYIVLKTNGLGLIPLTGMTNMPPTCIPVAGLRLTYSNLALCTIVGLNLLGLLGFALYFFTDGKKHKLTLNDLGLTPADSNSLSVKMILKTLLLSVVVIAIAWGLLAIQEGLFGTSFYAWFFGFKSIPVIKVKYYWAYILVWIVCFVIASFSINVERRLPTTGNELLDTVIAMAFNIVMASFTLVLVIIVNWNLSSAGVKETPWLWTFGTDITRLWGMPVGMAVGVGGSTLLYRKTGNTWLSAILMGTVAALMCVTFGQVRLFIM